MALDPSVMDVDPSQQVQSAQMDSMVRASVMGYGVMPDPQLVTESLLSGSGPTLTSAFASGDPALQGEILSQPIGQSQFAAKGVPPPTSLFHDPYEFDPQKYQQMVDSYKHQGLQTGFESMNMIPVANLGWFNHVLNGDMGTVKRWQQFLADRGYYGQTDANGNNFQKGEVSGYTSPQFQEAMKKWSLAYFLPQAIYSRDPQEMTNARQYLSGLGFDPTAIASSMSHNDAQRAKAVEAWVKAQGPDAGKLKALNMFADHFGADALPEKLNDIRGDGWLSSVGDAIHHFAPFIGSDDQDKLTRLTAAEKELLNPAIQNAHDHSGFLGFVGDVLTAPSKALVTVGYFFKDAASGQLGKQNLNPFDPTSDVSLFVNNPMKQMFGEQFVKDHPTWSFVGNVAANLLDDPLTYIPVVGEARLAEKLGETTMKAGETLTAAEKAERGKALMGPLERATGGLLSHRAGSLRYQFIKPTTVVRSIKNKELAATLSKALNPIESAQDELASWLVKPEMTHGVARQMLGGNLDNPQTRQTFDKLMALSRNQDKVGMLAFLRDPANGFAHRLITPDLMMNHRYYGKVLNNLHQVKDNQKAIHLWGTQSMNDGPHVVNFKDAPADAEEQLVNAAMTAGVSWDKISEFSENFWKAPGAERGAFQRHGHVDAFTKEIEGALAAKWAGTDKSVDQFKAWKEAMYSGNQRQKQESTLFGVQHDPTLPAEEMSKDAGPPILKDDVKLADGTVVKAADLNEQSKHIWFTRQAAIREWDNMVDAHARQLGDGKVTPELRKQAADSPELAAQRAAYQNAVKTFDDHMTDFKETWQGAKGTDPVWSKGSAPKATIMLPTQTAQWGVIRHTAADIAAYEHKWLRRSADVQHRLGLDKMMGMWKALVLSKPATSARIVAGDETSRFHLNFLLNDPRIWMQYVSHQARFHGKELQGMLDAEVPPELMSGMVAQMVAHQGINSIVPAMARDPGYREGFTHLIQDHYAKSDWSKEWANATTEAVSKGKDPDKAGRAAIKKALLADTDQGKLLREAHGLSGKSTDVALEHVVETKLADIKALTHYDANTPDRMHILNWISTGKVDQKTLKRLESTEAHDADYALPRIQMRPSVLHDAMGRMGSPLEWYHHNVTQAWVGRARGRGFLFKHRMELQRLEQFYGKDAAEKYGHNLNEMAQQQAVDWVKRNTYQGARSVLGSTLRSVAPFWGASANSNKFYLHTLMEHPELAHPFFRGENWITDQQDSGGVRMQIPGLAPILSKMGFAGGDQFNFDPLNSLFLTREGLGGFVPGMGPVFNSIVGVGNHFDPGLATTLSTLPGMQYAKGGTPVLPWLENISAGLPMAFGGNPLSVPLIAERDPEYYNKIIDEKLQQLEGAWEQGGRKGPAPTVEDAKSDVGKQRLATGLGGFTAPVGMSAEDEKRGAILDIQKATGEERSALLQKHPEVADYFKYNDPNTPEQPVSGKDSRQDILARSPWVLAYDTGTGESNVPGRATIADTQKQYQNDVQSGAISTMKPTAYLTKMRNQEEITQGWNEFDRLHAAYMEFLQTSGAATNSQVAKDWRKRFYDPQIQSLAKSYPEWGTRFIKQTAKTETGMEMSSAPFYSVSTFEVLPQNPALETRATTLWRAALIRRDQATSALSQVISNKGSQTEKNMILNGLAQELDQLAQQDPDFAAQLSRYRYRSLEDLITAQAQSQQAALG